MTADTPPSYPSLLDHLNALTSDSPPELDVRLIETFTAQLTEPAIPAVLPTLLPLLITTLEHLRTDPTPITTLLLRLIDNVPYAVLSPDPAQLLVTLRAPSPPIQNLGLELLRKAAEDRNSASSLAAHRDILLQVLRLSLIAPDTATADKSKAVLAALIKAGDAVRDAVFGDSELYGQFYGLTSWDGEDLGGKRQKTEAQGRLFGLLQEMVETDAVAWDLLQNGPEPSGQRKGLLEYAIDSMIRAEEDVMMQLVWTEFLRALVAAAPAKAYPLLQSLGKVDFLVAVALAPDEVVPDPLEQMLLQTPAAEFTGELIQAHPAALTDGLLERLLQHITATLRNNREAHVPTLTILAALPIDKIPAQLVTYIPLSPPDPAFLALLTRLLPARRDLLDTYIGSHPAFSETLLKHCATVSLGPAAAESLRLLERLAEKDPEGTMMLPGVAGFLVTAPQRFVGRDEKGWAWECARIRFEVVQRVWASESVRGGVWGERLAKRRREGVWAPGHGAEVATMGGEG